MSENYGYSSTQQTPAERVRSWWGGIISEGRGKMQGTSTSSWIHKIIGGTPSSVGPTCLDVVICYHLLDAYPPFRDGHSLPHFSVFLGGCIWRRKTLGLVCPTVTNSALSSRFQPTANDFIYLKNISNSLISISRTLIIPISTTPDQLSCHPHYTL